MAGSVEICDDLALRIGRHRAAPLSPSQAFSLAEQLIRRATRQIVIEECGDDPGTSRNMVLAAVRHADPTGPRQ